MARREDASPRIACACIATLKKAGLSHAGGFPRAGDALTGDLRMEPGHKLHNTITQPEEQKAERDNAFLDNVPD